MEKNKIMMIIIIVLIVVLIGAVASVGFFMYRNMKNSVADEGGSVEVVAQLKPEEMEEVQLSKAIATNLRKGSDGGEHMISVNFSIGIDNTDKKRSPVLLELLAKKETILRDICLGVVRDKTYEELSRPDGQDILRKEVLLKIQEAFQDNLIVTVYVFDMALQ